MADPLMLTAAVVTSSGAVAAAVETYRTRRSVERQEGAIYGEQDRGWDGLVVRSKRQEDRLDDHADALQEEGLL